MIKNILFNNVIYILSEIQNETSRALGTLEPFSIKNKTLFNLSGSGIIIQGSSVHSLKNGVDYD